MSPNYICQEMTSSFQDALYLWSIKSWLPSFLAAGMKPNIFQEIYLYMINNLDLVLTERSQISEYVLLHFIGSRKQNFIGCFHFVKPKLWLNSSNINLAGIKKICEYSAIVNFQTICAPTRMQWPKSVRLDCQRRQRDGLDAQNAKDSVLDRQALPSYFSLE